MSDRVFDASVERIRRYCEHSGQPAISVSFHGGEPCPIGSERFAQRCNHLRSEVGDSDTLHMVRQSHTALPTAEKVLRDMRTRQMAERLRAGGM
jgi:sulfatase maturation enzyme AslB (radical SAM superfamily)